MLVCPNCGHGNPDVARFCLACGAALGDPRPSRAEERRVVTVLFCDLVGFTSASEHADPEDVRARIDRYFARLRAAVERFGGMVEKFIGDAVEAVFGVPLAHEDDPERAVRAALRILEGIEDLNRTDPELRLVVRIGITTGEVLARLSPRYQDQEGIVTGDVVNTASRLQNVAPEGGIVVGEATYQATRHVFDYQAMDPVTVKGKSKPLPIWRPVRARARLGIDLRAHTGPMVGREDELELLKRAFTRAAHARSLQMVTVVGEPGIGKSRLMAEFATYVESLPDLITWRQGRCLPYGEGITFWALGEIVKAQAGILETDAPEVVGSKLDAAVPEDHPDAPWLRQRLRPLVGLDAPQAGREENFAAWKAFLEHLAERGPAVFVFEDLHWADDALLAFIEYLGEYAEGVPIVVLATARPYLYERFQAFTSKARNSVRLNLSPLNDSETARVIAGVLEQSVLPAELQDAVLSRAGGNPLYAEEFVRFLKDRGILRKQEGKWTMSATGEIPIPAGVEAIIASRLDTLDPRRKQMLQDAAVVGQVFWSGALVAMGERDSGEVDDALHELSRQELVRPSRRSSMDREHEYAFSHALVRDVCYAQIPRASRADRHRRAAAWIEQVAGDRVEDHAEILASHYVTALDLAAPARHPDSSDLRLEAMRYLSLAGDRALGMDTEAAERHYARALDLLPESSADRPEILARHAEALLQRGRFAEAGHEFDQAIEGFRRRGDLRGAAVSMGRNGIVLDRLGDPRSLRMAADAVAMLGPMGPSPELVQALTAQAGAALVADDYGTTIDLASRAMSMAQDLGLPPPILAMGFHAAARHSLGDPEALQEMRLALEAATSDGLGREGALLRYNFAQARMPIDGPRASIESFRDAIKFATSRGIQEYALSASVGLVNGLVAVGSWEQATATANAVAPELIEGGDLVFLLLLRSSQLTVSARRGDLGAAAALADWVDQTARQSVVHHIAATFPTIAMIRLSLGESAVALSVLSELERAPNVHQDPDFAWGLPDAVRTALSAGGLPLAGRLSRSLVVRHPLHEHALTTTQALLAEAQGEYSEAVEAFADAAERWARFEVPWERAQALLGQGRCLLTLGRKDKGTEPLRTARGVFASLGAAPALSETDALLQRAVAGRS